MRDGYRKRTQIRRRVFFCICFLAALYAVLRWFDGSGEVKWSYPALPGKGELHDIALSGDLLISLFADGSCVALDQHQGEEIWAHDSGAFPFRSRHLLTFRDRILVGGKEGLALLRSDNGEILWKRETPIQSRRSWAAGEPGLLVSQIQFRPYDDFMIPSRTGIPNEEWTSHSKVTFLSWEGGREVWTRNYGSSSIKQLDWMDSRSVILSHRTPIFEWAPCTEHGEPGSMERIRCSACRYERTQESQYQLEVFDPENAEGLWSRKLLATSLPLVEVAEDRLTLVTPRKAYCFSSAGTLYWELEFTDPVTVATQTEKELFVCLRDTQLISIDLASGKARWQRELNGVAEKLLPGRNRLYAVVAGLDVDWHFSENQVERFVRRTIARWRDPYQHLYFDTSAQLYFAAYRPGDGRRIWHRRLDSGSAVPGDTECLLLQFNRDESSAVRSEVESCSPGRGSMNWKYSTYAHASNILQGEKAVFVVSTSNSPRIVQSSTSTANTASKIIALRPRGLANWLTRF